MALNWKVSNIENWKATCFEEWDEEKGSGTMSAVTDGLIWATMFVGINEITEENWEAFYSRLHLNERLFGLMLGREDEDGKIVSAYTPEVIKAHIGLWTNATRISKAKYVKQQLDRWAEEQGSMEV